MATSRVAVLGSYAPSLINFRGPLLTALVKAGHEVYAIAPDINPKLAARLREMRVTPCTIEISNTGLSPIAGWATERALYKIFMEIRPTTLLSYTIKPVIFGSMAAHRARVPNIVALITGLGYAFTEGAGLKRRLIRLTASLLYGRALARCSSIIFQNPDDEADFRRLELIPETAHVAQVYGSGVDLGHFAPVPLPKLGARFLMIARLLGDKGVREYISAAALLKRRYPEAQFALAGYLDPSPDSLTQVELDAAIAGGMEFLGQQDDVRAAIADCNVYVLPSYYREGTPRSVLEAMAMGRAIVTSDAPGCRQTVNEGVNGRLVRPRDTADLAAKLEDFILNPEKVAPMGAASLALARDLFDADRVAVATMAAARLMP